MFGKKETKVLEIFFFKILGQVEIVRQTKESETGTVVEIKYENIPN